MYNIHCVRSLPSQVHTMLRAAARRVAFRGTAERWEGPVRPVALTLFVVAAVPTTYVACGACGATHDRR
jgi:hypothetical protein